MLNLLAKASQQVNLSPGERAILRFIETLVVGAALSGLQAVYPLLSSANLNVGAVDWQSVLHTFIAAVLMALYLGVSKYFKAFGDAPLPTQDTGA
jgi:hypothetical protein